MKELSIEPKFKIGDIITNGKIIGRVDENEDNKYHGWFGYDKDLSVHYADIPDVENWHKWTIQDAKDGDAIFYDDGWTCIFKNIHGIWYSSYCFITNDGEFHTGYERHAVHAKINGYAHPATKEQRDLLFQKMHEAGYEWDAEKKELKKIDFNPDDLIEESYQQQADDLIDMVTEKSAEWSEEDESFYNYLLGELNASLIDYCGASLEDITKAIGWLKSLKDRVQH